MRTYKNQTQWAPSHSAIWSAATDLALSRSKDRVARTNVTKVCHQVRHRLEATKNANQQSHQE